MADHKRLALLVCDTPVPAVLKSRGTYVDIFRDLLQQSNTTASFELDGYDVVNAQEYPDLDSYQGILISGSAASAYSDLPWINKLVQFVAETARNKPEVKLIGICFGHQIIARAMGGECVPNGGRWEVGVADVELTDIGKAVFKTNKPVIRVQEMHRDHVPNVPPDFELLGSTPISPVQGLVKSYSGTITTPLDIHILTVQGHPEFNADIVNHIIDVREKNNVLQGPTVHDGRENAIREHDGIGVIGRTIWRVLGVPI